MYIYIKSATTVQCSAGHKLLPRSLCTFHRFLYPFVSISTTAQGYSANSKQINSANKSIQPTANKSILGSGVPLVGP